MRELFRKAPRGIAAVVGLIAVGLVAVGLLCGYALSVVAQTPNNTVQNRATSVPKASADVSNKGMAARVADQVSPSVVQIDVRSVQQTPFGQQSSSGIGSGVIYTTDGYIITNNHVVEGAKSVKVSFADGSTVNGEVVGTDPYTDLAVVKVDRTGLPAAKFSEARKLVVGQPVVAIGSPSGFQSTVTEGIVSALHRELSSDVTGGPQEPSLTDLIQTDAAISPGNSGGALIDGSGKVIGINVAYLPQTQSGQSVEGIGFAIPSYTVTSVADQIIQNGQASHPYLGVALADLTPQIAQQFGSQANSGALVASVEKGGPASDAGIKRGDVITAIDSTKVEDSGALITALRQHQPGDTVSLTYASRNQGQQTTKVTLGSTQ